MNLTAYFLADLPPEATLTPTTIYDACQALKRNRTQYLQGRSTESIVRLLHNLGSNWLESDFPFRQMALELGPEKTGFSRATIDAGLTAFFSQLTRENLLSLITQDLGHPQRLDELTANPAEQKEQRSSFARGPEMLVHIAAGNLPNPTLMSIVLGLLVRSAQFVKCASGSAFLPRLFAHSLYEADPKLASCFEIAEWKGGHADLENALFAEADCVTATGSDEALHSIKNRLPNTTRFLGYGHQLSFAFITHEVLSGFNATKIVSKAVDDITAWDQHGCLSPHVLYVEHGGKISAEQFAEMLAEELTKLEAIMPRGTVSIHESAAIATRRSFYEIRAVGSIDTKLWQSQNSTAWTVIHESDPLFQISCLNRFIYVKSVSSLQQALQGADAVRDKISTVGLAATEDKAQQFANELARWGATRICALGQMQKPPLAWRHDGRPCLADLITWSDWEF